MVRLLVNPRQDQTPAVGQGGDAGSAPQAKEPSRAEPAKTLPPTVVTGQHDDDQVAGHGSDPFGDLHWADPQTASRLAQATSLMPEAGSEFLGFRLLEELGRGAFGRVFLAQQGALANRPVALKISAKLHEESQTLAQLQHTNIVPIFSVHHAGAFQAVCMPYLGSTTLADLCKELRSRGSAPLSGSHIVSTLHGRKASTLASAGSSVEGQSSDTSTAPPEDQPPVFPTTLERGRSQEILQRFKKVSYVQAVVWLAARLADGLAHAHERGIIHRDLKPANILLTDEGQPMLLDFNLSDDIKPGAAASVARVGGTIPYMAPERLEALRGEPRRVDARSDLYSLGLILFELLACRPAFATIGSTQEVLPAMIEERKRTVPALRTWNRAVSPAVEAIVRHCLHPDPDRRYQAAQDLREDLERQLADLPLKHAPERSVRERLQKWARRHPRLTSSTSIAALAGLLLVALSLGYVSRRDRLARLEAEECRRLFVDDARTAKTLLNRLEPNRNELLEGAGLCSRALERYGIINDPSWTDRAAVRLLPEVERQRLCADAGELLLVWARALALQVEQEPEKSKRQEQASLALRLNMLAGASWAGQRNSKGLRLQRAELTRLLGQNQEARQLLEEAERLQPQTGRDYYWLAIRHSDRGEYDKAIPLLRQATRLDPEDFWAWFFLGYCHGALLEPQAEYCYTTCVALASNSSHVFYPYFNRGLEYLKQQKYEAACADFDQAIRLRPNCADAYINRALARKELARAGASADNGSQTGNARTASPAAVRALRIQAEQDATEALKLNPALPRAYFIRAELRGEIGDLQGSQNDRALGMRVEPSDAPTWIDRGLARIDADPRGALADFENALQFSPRSHVAMQNKAHVLSERLGRPQEALAVLNKLVALYPGFVYARIGRGVLLARLGRRDEAHADARDSLSMDNSPSTYYQAANIYALTSRQNPDDKLQALPLLSIALRGGFGLDLIDTDTDLDPIRTHPDFLRLRNAARDLKAATERGRR
jgi:eukaryotic-like serine/threonine-protein kinase